MECMINKHVSLILVTCYGMLYIDDATNFSNEVYNIFENAITKPQTIW